MKRSLLLLAGSVLGGCSIYPSVHAPTKVSLANVEYTGRKTQAEPKAVTDTHEARGNFDALMGTQYEAPVVVRSTDGRTIHGCLRIFSHLDGTGPAGRGDYLVEISDKKFGEVSGGRMATAYETYGSSQGRMIAWIVVLSETPLRGCGS